MLGRLSWDPWYCESERASERECVRERERRKRVMRGWIIHAREVVLRPLVL